MIPFMSKFKLLFGQNQTKLKALMEQFFFFKQVRFLDSVIISIFIKGTQELDVKEAPHMRICTLKVRLENQLNCTNILQFTFSWAPHTKPMFPVLTVYLQVTQYKCQ